MRVQLADPEQAPALCCSAVGAPGITRAEAGTLAEVFKALADPNRVLIVNLLAAADEPVCVCDVTARLGLAQGTVSFHLKKLLRAGLLVREERGTWAYYALNREALSRVAGAFELERGER